MRNDHDRFRVLIAGGGIAGIEALLALADLADHQVDVEILTPRLDFVLRPQMIGAPWGGRPLRADLLDLTSACHAKLWTGFLAEVDAGAHTVTTTAGMTLTYDALLVGVGATPVLAYPGVRTVGFGALPDVLARPVRRTMAILVPPGTGWTLPAYQLALLAAGGKTEVRIITPEGAPLEAFGRGPSERVADLLSRNGITMTPRSAIPVGSETARDEADVVLALPQLRGPRIAGLPRDRAHFLPVDAGLRVTDVTDVWAAGDATAGSIKQGGLAAQQAERAAHEIMKAAGVDVPEVAEPPTLRGKLVVGDEALYLRRVLDGFDPGTASNRRLWQPEASMCAWRLTRWLDQRSGDLGASPLGPMAKVSS